MKNLVYILILLFPYLSCGADIFTVDDDGPADFNNIQAAIDYSSDGDIIIVQPGHYDGVKRSYPPFYPGKSIHFFGKNIVLTSTNPSNLDTVSSTVIDAMIMFNGTEEPNCVLSGFKIAYSEVMSFDCIIGNNCQSDDYPFRTKATITDRKSHV